MPIITGKNALYNLQCPLFRGEMDYTIYNAHYSLEKCIIQVAMPNIPGENALYNLQCPLFTGKMHYTTCNARY